MRVCSGTEISSTHVLTRTCAYYIFAMGQDSSRVPQHPPRVPRRRRARILPTRGFSLPERRFATRRDERTNHRSHHHVRHRPRRNAVDATTRVRTVVDDDRRRTRGGGWRRARGDERHRDRAHARCRISGSSVSEGGLGGRFQVRAERGARRDRDRTSRPRASRLQKEIPKVRETTRASKAGGLEELSRPRNLPRGDVRER